MSIFNPDLHQCQLSAFCKGRGFRHSTEKYVALYNLFGLFLRISIAVLDPVAFRGL